MKRRRLPIDWSALEFALTSQSDEGGHCLNLETGEIILYLGLDDELDQEEIDAGLAEGRLIDIEPLPSSVAYDWMVEFAESADNEALRRLLGVALNGRGAFRRFKDVLAEFPGERERWFAFHDDKVRQEARDWLEVHGIEATTQSGKS